MSSNDTELYSFRPFTVVEVLYRSETIPRPRSGHRIACVGGNIYLYGGYNPTLTDDDASEESNPTWTYENPLFKELWVYNIAKRTWRLHRHIQNMPEELASSAMTAFGKHLLIYGGTGVPFGNKCNDNVIVWDTRNKYYKRGRFMIPDTTGDVPQGMYGQCIVCYDGYLYSIGGTDGFVYNCDVHRLNLETMEWRTLFYGHGHHDEPGGRYRHEVMVYDNKLFVLGGGTSNLVFKLHTIPVFDLTTNTWSHQASKPDQSFINPVGPQGRKCHSAVQLKAPANNQVYLACGYSGDHLFGCIWLLDLKDLQWTLMKKSFLPSQLYFHSSIMTDEGCMYVFGGIEMDATDMCRNNNMHKMWACIPKLSEIAWDAVSHYYTNMRNTSRRSLLQLGIPSHFVERVWPK